MKKFWVSLVLGVAMLAAPGVARADITLLSIMNAASEVPPNDSPGIGLGVVIISEDFQTLSYFVAFENLVDNAIVSHIHVGTPDVAGPIIFNFTGIPNSTSGTFFGTLTADDFRPGGGLDTYDDAIYALLTGGTYTNVHTPTNPGGEIRQTLYVFDP